MDADTDGWIDLLLINGEPLEDISVLRDPERTLSWAKLDDAPAILRVTLVAPYLRGLQFVAAVQGRGGWPAVNNAHRRPPVSSEQVLHPEKYFAREPGETIEIPELGELRMIYKSKATASQSDSWKKEEIKLPGVELSPRAIANMVRVGLPAAWEGFIDMGGFLMFTIFVGTAGAVPLAASQITIQLLSFSFMPLWGLTTAASVLTGNWIGAGKPDTAAHYGRQTYKLGTYYSLGLALVIIFPELATWLPDQIYGS